MRYRAGMIRTSTLYSADNRCDTTSNCKLPDRAENHRAAKHRTEHLDRAFIAELPQRFTQLLRAHRIDHFHRLENFRREERQADELQQLAFGQAYRRDSACHDSECR